MKAYIKFSSTRTDGSRDSFATIEVPAKISELQWQKAGLHYTASGYGRRIPTRYMVRFGSRWRRVYAYQIRNAGTLYIGALEDRVTVHRIE